MKGSIKIDIADHGDGKGLQPVIRVVTYPGSDDVRDQLLRTFFQGLGGWSNWVKVEWVGVGQTETRDAHQSICLTPVGLSELEEMKKVLDERIIEMKSQKD